MLHIIANRFTLTEFLLDSLPDDQRQRVAMHPRRIKGTGYSLLKALDAFLPFRLPGFRPFPSKYLRQLEAIGPQDAVLIFGIENIKDLRIVRKYLRPCQVSVFTFDPGDAQRYGLTLVKQVYRPVDTLLESVPQEIDIYFSKSQMPINKWHPSGRHWSSQP